MATEAPGQIITFYSYKGGTGRSMALANVAWILASNGKRVLMVDWDLEAPGLHRYIHPFLRDKELRSSDGVIEFVVNFAAAAVTPPPPGDESQAMWYVPLANVLRYATSLNWDSFRKPGLIDFIPAGRQGPAYATSVNFFNWQQFYEKLGGHAFLEAAKDKMRRVYDYVLIDSRTGVSDTSGICTIQMPDIVVLCFTLNTQSIEGAVAVAESIDQQRREGSKKTIRIFPVPTRVEEREHDKLERARSEAWRKFTPYLWHIPREQHAEYWGSIEIFYRSQYAFEEVIAPFGDRPLQRNSLLAEMERLTAHITAGQVTGLQPVTELQRQTVAAQFERHGMTGDDSVDVMLRRIEKVYGGLSASDQRAAMRLLKRLIRVPQPNEQAVETTLTVTEGELSEVPGAVLKAFADGNLVTIVDGPKERTVTLADPVLIAAWTPLRIELDADREFLRWRQTLPAVAWASSRDRGELLRGQRLDVARSYLGKRPEDLNTPERRYIAASQRASILRQWALAAEILLPLLTLAVLMLARNTTEYTITSIIREAPQLENDLTAKAAVGEWLSALTVSDHLPIALNTARAIRDPSNRAGMLARIAAQVPETQRGAIVDESVTVAAKIADPAVAVKSLLDVAEVAGRGFDSRAIAGAQALVPRILASHQTEASEVIASIGESSANRRMGNPGELFRRATSEASKEPAEIAVRQLVNIAGRMDNTANADIKGQAAAVRARALERIPAIEDRGHQMDRLKEVVAAFTPLGNEQESLSALRFLSHATLKVDTDKVFLNVLRRLQLVNQSADYLAEFPSLIGNRGSAVRCSAWALFAKAVASNRGDATSLISGAETCLSSVRDPFLKAESTADLADARFAASKAAAARASLLQAMTLADSVQPRSDAAPAYIRIANVALSMDNAALADVAVHNVVSFPDDEEAAELLQYLAANDVVTATRYARLISDDSRKDAAIIGIVGTFEANHAPRQESEKQLMAAIGNIESAGTKEAAYASMAKWLAPKLPDDSEAVARGHLYDDKTLATSFLEIARSISDRPKKAKLIGEAIEHAQAIGSTVDKSPLLAEAAQLLAGEGDLAGARAQADRCPLPNDKLRAYAAILKAYARKPPSPPAATATHGG